MTESMPTPRELAEMIVNAQYDSKEPNLDILVDELLAYMKDGYPRKTAQLQIQSAIENIQVKEKKKNNQDKNRHSLLDDAYTYAIKLIQQKGTEDIVNTQLKLYYWFEHKGLTLDESYDIIHKAAKKDFEQAVTKEPGLEPTQEFISKKEPEIATSIESQDDIKPRLETFALNFLFKFQDPGKEILRSELIKAMNDYIEHFSLKYSAVQKLADKAIAEFRVKSKTTPELKTAYQELYKNLASPGKAKNSYDVGKTDIQPSIGKKSIDKLENLASHPIVSDPESKNIGKIMSLANVDKNLASQFNPGSGEPSYKVVKKRTEFYISAKIQGLYKKYKKCNKKGCRCLTGKEHGPYYYLYIKDPNTGVRREIYFGRAK